MAVSEKQRNNGVSSGMEGSGDSRSLEDQFEELPVASAWADWVGQN